MKQRQLLLVQMEHLQRRHQVLRDGTCHLQGMAGGTLGIRTT